jgi:hypothetical protein
MGAAAEAGADAIEGAVVADGLGADALRKAEEAMALQAAAEEDDEMERESATARVDAGLERVW